MTEAPLTILLIEDNPGDARLIRELLADAARQPPVRIEWANCLLSGLTRLADGGINAVLLDLWLPDGAGMETVTRVHAQAPSVPLIVLTGLEDEALGLQAMQAGAQDYLVKGQVNGPGLHRAVRYAVERSRIAEALRASEQRFRAIFDQTYQFIGLLSPDGTVLEANQASLDFGGLTRADVIGQPFWAVRWWNHSAAEQERLQRAIAAAAQGEFVRYEAVHRRADGQVVPIDFSLKPVTDETGRVVLLIPEGRDITERKRLEEAQHFLIGVSQALANSLDYEATLQRVARLAVPTLADACIVNLLDEQGGLRQVAVAHRDPSKEELLREVRRAHPFDPASETALAEVLHSGQPQLVTDVSDTWRQNAVGDPEHRARLRALVALSSMAVPLLVRGKPVGVLVLTTGESRRRYGPGDLALAQQLAERAALAIEHARLFAAEQQARRTAERQAAELAAILGQIADGVIIADPSGQIAFVNVAARHLCGLPVDGPPDDLVLTCLRTPAGDPYPPEEHPLTRAVTHGDSVVNLPMRIQQPDGSVVTVRGSAVPVVAEDGRRLGAVLTLHDVTAQAELERQKDEFLASISHDLRTPLTAISVAVGTILDNEPPGMPEPIHRLFVTIDQAAVRMVRLVTDLLELTRLQAGRVQPRRTRCDLRAVIHRAAQTIEPLAQARGQHLTLRLPPAPVVAYVDGERLERALLNLLSNANAYGRPGGSIEIRLLQHHEEVRLAVTDDGPGISLHDQRFIFDRYYRAAAAKAHRQGSGLGLAIARATIDLHGGQIWVESTPGHGATFWITLPRHQPEDAHP